MRICFKNNENPAPTEEISNWKTLTVLLHCYVLQIQIDKFKYDSLCKTTYSEHAKQYALQCAKEDALQYAKEHSL